MTDNACKPSVPMEPEDEFPELLEQKREGGAQRSQAGTAVPGHADEGGVPPPGRRPGAGPDIPLAHRGHV